MSQSSVTAARFTRLAAPVASPGNCGICGKSSHPEGFAYFDLHFEFYGTLYFCADCVGEVARLFNYISTTTAGNLEEAVAQQAEELQTLRQAIVLLENTVEQLTDYRRLREYKPRNSGNFANGSVVSDEKPDHTSEASLARGTYDDGTADQFGSEPRRDDVRDATGPESGTSPVPL